MLLSYELKFIKDLILLFLAISSAYVNWIKHCWTGYPDGHCLYTSLTFTIKAVRGPRNLVGTLTDRRKGLKGRRLTFRGTPLESCIRMYCP